jgi:hypothetical protein
MRTARTVGEDGCVGKKRISEGRATPGVRAESTSTVKRRSAASPRVKKSSRRCPGSGRWLRGRASKPAPGGKAFGRHRTTEKEAAGDQASAVARDRDGHPSPDRDGGSGPAHDLTETGGDERGAGPAGERIFAGGAQSFGAHPEADRGVGG